MLVELGDGLDLSHVREAKDARGYTSEINLPKDLTLKLVAGYNVKLRKRIIDSDAMKRHCKGGVKRYPLSAQALIDAVNSTDQQISVSVIADDSGEPWFNAKEICDVLGYGNHRQAVDTHVDTDDVQKLDAIDNMGRKQMDNHINESGLYSLIFGSTKEEANGSNVGLRITCCRCSRKFRPHKRLAVALPWGAEIAPHPG